MDNRISVFTTIFFPQLRTETSPIANTIGTVATIPFQRGLIRGQEGGLPECGLGIPTTAMVGGKLGTKLCTQFRIISSIEDTCRVDTSEHSSFATYGKFYFCSETKLIPEETLHQSAETHCVFPLPLIRSWLLAQCSFQDTRKHESLFPFFTVYSSNTCQVEHLFASWSNFPGIE